MFGSLERVKEMFAKRFEPDGGGYLFRANLQAVGYSVSAAERDRLLTDFSRRLTWLTWGGASLITLVIVGVGLVMISRSDQAPPDALIWATIGVSIGLYLIPFYWLWNAPTRELRERAGVAPARTKAEARRIAFQRLTWGQLGVAALGVPVLLWRVRASQGAPKLLSDRPVPSPKISTTGGASDALVNEWNSRGVTGANAFVACPKLSQLLPSNFSFATGEDWAALHTLPPPRLFSIIEIGAPLVSEDGRSIIIQQNLRCPGLCGGGSVRRYTRTRSGWSQPQQLLLWMS